MTPPRALPTALAAALLLSSCTLVEGYRGEHPPGLYLDGLVDGHVAFGMPDHANLLEARLLDGPSDGSIVYAHIGDLLAVEVGVVGAYLSIGPLHLGLGTLFYEPWPIDVPYESSSDADTDSDAVAD